jgi:hypothetical protein
MKLLSGIALAYWLTASLFPACPAAFADQPPVSAPEVEPDVLAKLVFCPVPVIPRRFQTLGMKKARVRFDIAPDGSCLARLLTSSGDPPTDRAIVGTLNTWRWTPALKNGYPISSTAALRIELGFR